VNTRELLQNARKRRKPLAGWRQGLKKIVVIGEEGKGIKKERD